MTEVTGILALVGKRASKRVKFLGEDITIRKLTVAEVRAVQELAKELEGKEDDNGIQMLELVIKSSVVGGDQLTTENFEEWPIDELATLSNDIMKYSGFNKDEGKSA